VRKKKVITGAARLRQKREHKSAEITWEYWILVLISCQLHHAGHADAQWQINEARSMNVLRSPATRWWTNTEDKWMSQTPLSSFSWLLERISTFYWFFTLLVCIYKFFCLRPVLKAGGKPVAHRTHQRIMNARMEKQLYV